MKRKKNTKRALLSSIVSLILCFSMLLGSTFAWFTDSAATGVNTIQSGNLDVVLEYKTDWDDDWKEVTSETKLFKEDALYEPGYTEVVYLRVANEGSLALKYDLKVKAANERTSKNVYDETFKLSDYLEIGAYVQDEYSSGFNYADTLMPTMFGTRESAISNIKNFTKVSDFDSIVRSDALVLPGEQTAQVAALVLRMPEEVGNEANHKTGVEVPKLELGIELVATQYTHEEDSFDNQYDEDAEYPTIENIVERGTFGGIDWTLTDAGTLTISPTASPVPDANSGKEFESGAWREAVVYRSDGEANYIGGYPYDVNAVKKLVIEEGVTSIGSFTAKFPNLTGEVVIPSTVTYIGQEAFQNAPITKLTFAEGGTKALCIAPGAFKKLAIEELVLPEDRSDVHVHCWAFNDCTNLKSVTFPANVTTFSKWTHVDYCGMDYVNGYDSQILARCGALEILTFGSQEVKEMFFNAPYNKNNIDAIGSVEIVVK